VNIDLLLIRNIFKGIWLPDWQRSWKWLCCFVVWRGNVWSIKRLY